MTVDKDIQFLIREELIKYNEIFRTKGSAAILINVNNGEIIWAGIVSNVPLLAMALIAGASCHNSEKSIKSVRQHIYMLAYQTWPNNSNMEYLEKTI